jgi:SRSO17 transposase
MWQRLWKKNFRPQAAAGSQQPGTAPLPLEQMGERFLGFWQRYRSHFQGATRSVEQQAWQYLKGLLQSVKRNIERMVEKVPEADYQAQQHFVTYSPWRHQAVLEQVAAEANQLLGGDRDRGLILDESGFPKQGKKICGGRATVVWELGQSRQLPGGGLCSPLLPSGSDSGR